MKKIRFYYWIIKSFASKHKKALIPAAIVGALSFTQIGLLIRYVPEPKPTRYVGRVGTYSLATLPRDIQNSISAGLTRIDETGAAVPALASEWNIVDDGKTYIFKIREDVTWQDGTPVTAHDISYNITDVTSEVQDDKTIVFRLEEPYAPFPTIVSQPLFKRIEKSYAQVIHRTIIVGTGEYEIKKLDFSGNELEEITLNSEKEKIIYRFYDTEKSAVTAYKLAQIDELEDLTRPTELADWDSVEITSTTSFDRYAAIFFNTSDDNLTNKSVRQALAYAIPKKPTDETRAISPIAPTSWAYNPQVKSYEYSMEQAQELMQNKKVDFEVEITTTPAYFRLAEEIKSSWEQLGPIVSIKVVNVPDTRNYQALLIGQQVPKDPDQYLFWHSTQIDSTNITGYQSARVDKLLEDGRKELDQNKRKEIYLDFQRFLVEDTPAAFLFYLDAYTLKRK